MSILKRIRTYFVGSIHDIIDLAEDPESKVNQIIRELEEGLVELRKGTASAMASLYVAEENLSEIKEESALWLKNAELALKEDREDLARKSLEKKNFYDDRITSASKQVEDDRLVVNQLKDDLRQAEETVEKARLRRETLIAQRRAAEARSGMLDSSEKLKDSIYSVQSASGAETFRESEMDLRRLEAENRAKAELLGKGSDSVEREMHEMQKKVAIDQELEALKSRLAKEGE